MKVLVTIGTRPEAIKLAPVIFELNRRKIQTIICTTGQHKEMLKQTLDVFEIKPKFEFTVMKESQSLNELTSSILVKFDKVLEEVNPDWVIVQGDTATAFCATLAAFYRKINVGHVEAGLRTGNLSSPFPEEGNRKLISMISKLHFSPTLKSKLALISEGVDDKNIYVTGNTVIDAVHWVSTKKDNLNDYSSSIFKDINVKSFVLVTCHRRENMGDVLDNICVMLSELASSYKNIDWVIPVHLNPQIKMTIENKLEGFSNIKLIEPMNYVTTLAVLKRAIMVVTDSGGIQEEAPSFGIPTVVMRNHTERTEGVENGFSTLAGQSTEKIKAAVCMWLDSEEMRNEVMKKDNPYGDGKAASRIVSALIGEKFTQFNY